MSVLYKQESCLKTLDSIQFIGICDELFYQSKVFAEFWTFFIIRPKVFDALFVAFSPGFP